MRWTRFLSRRNATPPPPDNDTAVYEQALARLAPVRELLRQRIEDRAASEKRVP